jgi:hypothetical protein
MNVVGDGTAGMGMDHGTFYGTTTVGVLNNGTIFKMTPGGAKPESEAPLGSRSQAAAESALTQ